MHAQRKRNHTLNQHFPTDLFFFFALISPQRLTLSPDYGHKTIITLLGY